MPVLLVERSEPARGAPPASAPVGTAGSERLRGRGQRLSAAALETFTRDLETQVEAGVSLARALQVQAENAPSPAVAALSSGLLRQLNSGLNLSDALDLHPRTFSSVYRSLVRAGEHSGRLPLMLRELADFLAWREDVRKLVRRASVYPAVVVVTTLGVLVLIVGYVLPKFGDLFARLGDATPAAARVLLAAGNALSAHWLEAAALAVGALVAAVLLLRSERVRGGVHRVAGRMPVAAGVLRAIDLARVSRTLAILASAGIPLVRAVDLSREVVGDPRTAERLGELSKAVVGGQMLSQAAAASGVFPGVALSLLAVGEEAGQMPAVLDRLARTFDRDARDSVQKALALLEPAFTILLGVMVGGLALVVITTLYKTMMVVGR